MNKRKNSLVALAVLLTAALACNVPAGQSPTPYNQNPVAPQAPSPEQQVPLPTGSIPETFTPSPTSTTTLTPTITPTFTPAVPMVSVSQDTNCRTGPGKIFNESGALLSGESAEVVGKNTESGYWIIKNPDGAGTCWLWGYYATISGNESSIVEMTPPATPTPSIPNPPKNVAIAKICILIPPGPLFQYGGTVTWEDNSDNEDGFNVYFNGSLLGTVGPNITTHPIPVVPFPAGTPLTMGVEAFNVTGKSAMKTATFTCP